MRADISFRLETHPGEARTSTSPGCDPYVEASDLKHDGRDRLWSMGVQQALDELATKIAEDLEERP